MAICAGCAGIALTLSTPAATHYTAIGHSFAFFGTIRAAAWVGIEVGEERARFCRKLITASGMACPLYFPSNFSILARS
jgi:hypothetical protein